MTKKEFMEKYEDKLMGALMRGVRSAVAYNGDSAREGMAIKNAFKAVEALWEQMLEDLFPQPLQPTKPVIPHGAKR